MAFLDFIRKRNAPEQQSIASKVPEQRPETAKKMCTLQSREKANQKPMDRMPPDQQAKVDSIKATLERATQHVNKSPDAPASTPPEGTGSREAMRQNMTGQDKTAPALSPTSAETGQTAEKNAPAPDETPARTQQKTPGLKQTLSRPRPSWER